MTKPTLTHAVAVVEADDKHALIVRGSNNEHRYWVPLNALHPLPPPDPLATAVVEAAKAWADSTKNGIPVPGSPQDILRQAVNVLSAAERPQEATLRECKCGATPTMTQVSGHASPMAQVVCAECGRRGPNCWTVATAAAAWNARGDAENAEQLRGKLMQAQQDIQNLFHALRESRHREAPCTVCLDRDGVLEVIAHVTGPAREHAEALVNRVAAKPKSDAQAVIGELDAAVHSWVHAVGVLTAVQCASPVEGREDAAHRTVFAAKRRYTAAKAAAEALVKGE